VSDDEKKFLMGMVMVDRNMSRAIVYCLYIEGIYTQEALLCT
jgi:hypothetical protein